MLGFFKFYSKSFMIVKYSLVLRQTFPSLCFQNISKCFPQSAPHHQTLQKNNKVSNRNYKRNHKCWEADYRNEKYVAIKIRWRSFRSWHLSSLAIGLREASRLFHGRKWMIKWNNVTAHPQIPCVNFSYTYAYLKSYVLVS